MSESIAEMVIPGTYIEVRAEGLISVGGIATGTLGVVGTAGRGPVNQVRRVGSLSDAVDLFGGPDPFSAPRVAGAPLNLTRTLEQAFAGGARNVVAVRIANATPTPATLELRTASNDPAFTMTARGINDADGVEIAGSSGSWARDIGVDVASDNSSGSVVWRLTLTYGSRREVFTGANVGEVLAALATSRFVSVGATTHATAGFTPTTSALPFTGGADGADVTAVAIGAGLAALENEQVNIVLVGGSGANVAGNAVKAHLTRTESEGRERIALLGCRASGEASTAAGVESDAEAFGGDGRLVLVAPGIITSDSAAGANGATITLPPSYLAAAVAGKLSTLAPHISLTNKSVPVTPDVRYSTPLITSLLGRNILLVRQKFGAQIVRGITSSAPPFQQISIRRTVDYAKAGVRLGADPYIGRLNNSRVRAALQATLDGFLSQMVLDEMLVGYQLEVSATRAQERAGICQVIMTLLPTFSIDYIRVTMNLE